MMSSIPASELRFIRRVFFDKRMSRSIDGLAAIEDVETIIAACFLIVYYW
jgi:penicillin V acylase-like amidase (Ntn superfamily)